MDVKMKGKMLCNQSSIQVNLYNLRLVEEHEAPHTQWNYMEYSKRTCSQRKFMVFQRSPYAMMVVLLKSSIEHDFNADFLNKIEKKLHDRHSPTAVLYENNTWKNLVPDFTLTARLVWLVRPSCPNRTHSIFSDSERHLTFFGLHTTKIHSSGFENACF